MGSVLSNHLHLDHKNMQTSTDYQCLHCHRIFVSSTALVLHSKAKHPLKPVLINVRHVKTREDLGFEEEEMSISSEDEKEEENSIDVTSCEEQKLKENQVEQDAKKN